MKNPSGPGRTLLAALVALVSVGVLAVPVEAQYFGRNKVQYDDFDWQVLTTDHFDLHFYEEQEEATEDIARMAERWYERFARVFQHDFEARKPLIMYADHPDFQQTNTLRGAVGESTGGVTESLKNRVIMPMTGSYADTDHVLGHELVHAFQYNIAQSRRGGGLQGLSTLPLWSVEGMAEYLSVGREDTHTAMWLRDAVRRDDFPTIEDMTKEQRFFPYRFGQALWAYVGGTYGDDAVVEIFRRSLRVGFGSALGQVLGLSADTLSVEWRRSVEQQYIPLMEGRTAPEELGQRIIDEENAGSQNVSPSLSPDGRFVAFISEKDLFTYSIFLADAETGEIVRRLVSADSDPHVDALRFVESSGTWSPDGRFFAYVVFADGDNQIRIVETEDGDRSRTIHPEGIGAINNPSWSPDGRYIAFTGIVGGISDLYVWDLETSTLTQLTDDKHADFHADWSPDGSTLAFVSDRGPETDFDLLRFSRLQISLLDVETRQVETLSLFENARHINPQFSPDGRTLYFISDQDGFSDIYALDLDESRTRRLTRVATGVSGITSMSPALSVADETGRIALTVFNEFGFTIHTLPASYAGEQVTVAVQSSDIRGRRLPPAEPGRFSRIAEYLEDPTTGLPAEGVYSTDDAVDYESGLALDYIGQPSIGVGADQFGNYVGGGASAFFSDMLGNKLLGVAVQAQGTIKDIGGQVQYADLSDRWNWGVSAGRIPYLQIYQGFGRDESGRPFVSQIRERTTLTSIGGQVAYPFSQTRRVEFGASAVRYSFDLEQDLLFVDSRGRVIDVREADDELTEFERDPINLGQGSVAYVGDNAFFAFTSPVRGERFRYQLQQTVGDENFTTAIADYRRYFQPDRNLTFAVRGLHYGRYGGVEGGSPFDRTSIIRPLFLGFETFIRGYSYESFEARECTQESPEGEAITGCAAVDRLFGHRLAVANAEFRVPLLGVEQFGLINFPFLPTELVAFADAGLAWDAENDPVLEFSRTSAERIPVFSTGVGARFNILGFMILEAYYAYPFQRPEKGGHWGFQIAPGW